MSLSEQQAHSGTRIATIGVYGFDRESFLEALKGGGVDLLLDVRQRRGVRGPEYAWANSARLQKTLTEAGIRYSHLKELAPTTAMREAQYRADARRHEGKRSRTAISDEYARLYTEGVLDRADLDAVMRWVGSSHAALLCVERDPEACHRSLIAARLRERYGFTVEDLRPPDA